VKVLELEVSLVPRPRVRAKLLESQPVLAP